MPAKRKRIRPVIEEVAAEPVKETEEKVEESQEKEDSDNLPQEETQEQLAEEEKTEELKDSEETEPEQIEESVPEEHEPKDMLTDSSLSANPPVPPPSSPPQKGSSLKLMLFVTILTALVVGFVAGGIYVYYTGLSSLGGKDETPQATLTPTPTATPQVSPSPEPEEVVDVSSYKISVLNGSGKIGEAGKVQDLLEGDGFTVSNVGNATRYDYKNTIIQATKDVPENVIEKLQNSLSDTYTVEVGDTLSSSTSYDIIVTVGQN